MQYEHITKSANLEDRIDSIIKMEGSVLCEILGTDTQEYVEIAVTRNKNNGLVRRPLEDQYPFLEEIYFYRNAN